MTEGLIEPCGPLFASLFGPVSNVWEDFFTEGLIEPCGTSFASLLDHVSNVWEDLNLGKFSGS